MKLEFKEYLGLWSGRKRKKLVIVDSSGKRDGWLEI